MDDKCIQGSNYLQLQKKCSEEQKSDYVSTPSLTLPKEKRFNDSTLPKNIEENTTFGVQTKSKLSAIDVIFCNRSASTKFGYDAEDKTEYYKNYDSSYRSNGIGKQFNRKYTTSFDPDCRYGKPLKKLPAGIWFKCNIEPKASHNTDCVPKICQSEINKRKSCLSPVDIITGTEPDKKYSDHVELLSAINKIKYFVKKRKYDLKDMLETYKLLDKESTGWLPLEQVYEICYQYQIIPDRKLFDIALHSVHAIDDSSVRYDLFTDLLDPNVKYSAFLKKDNRTNSHECNITTYKNDYESRSSQNARSNKKFDYTSTLSHAPVKWSVFADHDSFGSETDVKTLLSPTIFTNYGLSYKDFYIGRDKEVMQKLFDDAGINLKNDVFNVIWDNASQKCDNNDGKVGIEDFRQALRDFQAEIIDRQEAHQAKKY